MAFQAGHYSFLCSRSRVNPMITQLRSIQPALLSFYGPRPSSFVTVISQDKAGGGGVGHPVDKLCCQVKDKELFFP